LHEELSLLKAKIIQLKRFLIVNELLS